MRKISIIINGFEVDNKNIERCLESIKKQSYKNIETIIIKDIKSENNYQTNGSIQVLESSFDDNNDIYTLGYEHATGDLISFISGNDYISCDYYRKLEKDMDEEKSDISISEYAKEENNEYIKYQFMDLNKYFLDNNKKVVDLFLETELTNDRWYINQLKLIKKELMEKIIPIYAKYKTKTLLEKEILLSILLYVYAKKVSFCDTTYFIGSTDDFHQNFNCSKLIQFLNKCKLDVNFEKLSTDKIKDLSYYNSKAKYNFEEEKIKESIIDENIKIVSFDMFDTLIVRPFYEPIDMFKLMDKHFFEISNSSPVTKFSKIRVEIEQELRRSKNKEITINEIYDAMNKKLSINKNICKEMQNLEKKLEEKFCYKREFAYDLYSLAKYLNKRAIIVSDIYLDKTTINNILRNNTYKFDEIYISSEIGDTKGKGSLYEYVLKKEKIDGKNILHIGDNEGSDYLNAKEKGLNAFLLPRTIKLFMDYGFGKLYQDFDMFTVNMDRFILNLGVRCSIGIVANKYFDNPFRTIDNNTKFNQDPELIGSYALGMHLLALSNWLLNDTKMKNIDSLSFISRDGHLPYIATKVFNNNTKINSKIKLNYIYASRKSLLPAIYKNKDSVIATDTYVNYERMTPRKILELYSQIIDKNEEVFIKELNKNKIKIDEKLKNKEDFYKIQEIIFDELYNKKKYENYCEIVKEYLNDNLLTNPAVFDIGYSGKPQAIISSLLNKKIHTYFYHTTSNEAYENSYVAGYELNTFYDFMPTSYGAMRELFYSDIAPTCISYKRENNKCVPVFGKEEEYTYFNKNMILLVQQKSIEFVDNYTKIFSDYIDLFSFNKFYMSSIYEYYSHYTDKEDKNIFYNLIFESNVDDVNTLNHFIDLLLNNYHYCNINRKKAIESNTKKHVEDYYNDIIQREYTKLPKKRLKRILYYLLFDQAVLLNKVRTKIKRK